VANRLQGCFAVEGAEDSELFDRKGEKPAFTDQDHQDTRPIVGLTQAGWRAWAEAGLFLRRHGGPGPWDSASDCDDPPGGGGGVTS
jgi:hypothetical protein